MAKILILANNDVGLYKFRKELIQELIDQGNQVFISLPSGDLVKPLIEMGCKFINTDIDRRGLNPIVDLKLITRYFEILKNIKPDKVITYTVKPNIYGGIVSRINKVHYVINITGLGTAFQKDNLLKKIIIYLYKTSCKRAGIVFFENEENQKIFIDNKIVKEEKTCKLNGAGVNLQEYKFTEYPEKSSEINILFIGRVMKEKGIEELFQVAELIQKEFKNINFDIVGPCEDCYEKKIAELEKQGVINYYGYQKDIKPFIKKAHCFILPSYHEGMANTLLECGAMGRPLLTTNISGCKEAVIDGTNGYLVKVKDSNDLYIKLKDFILTPYIEKAKMGRASREHIEKVFDKKLVIKKTLQMLT